MSFCNHTPQPLTPVDQNPVYVSNFVKGLSLALLSFGLACVFPVQAKIQPVPTPVSQPADADCVRGEPFPWFTHTSPAIASLHYQRLSATRSLERVTLRSGEWFSIANTGCESYVIRIHYAFKGPAPADGDIRAWRQKAAVLLKYIASLSQIQVFQLARAGETLSHFVPDARHSQDPHPVAGDGSDFMQAQVALLDQGRTATGGFVEVELSRAL